MDLKMNVSGQFSDLDISFEMDSPDIKTVKHNRNSNEYGLKDSLKQNQIIK